MENRNVLGYMLMLIASVVKLPALMSFTTWFVFKALKSRSSNSIKGSPLGACPKKYAWTETMVPLESRTFTCRGMVNVTRFTVVGPLSTVCQSSSMLLKNWARWIASSYWIWCPEVKLVGEKFGESSVRSENGAKGMVARTVPSSLSKVSETSVIFAGICVVLPTRGSFPIITNGKTPLGRVPRMDGFGLKNEPVKVGTVSNPVMTPPIVLVVMLAAILEALPPGPLPAAFASEEKLPLEVSAPSGKTRRGAELTGPVELSIVATGILT